MRGPERPPAGRATALAVTLGAIAWVCCVACIVARGWSA
ncbi:hypothetical protein M2167_007480 [Streptomyces sp. SPB4]|nr:hypothetical protein [Streptomyces sp. SPB4]